MEHHYTVLVYTMIPDLVAKTEAMLAEGWQIRGGMGTFEVRRPINLEVTAVDLHFYQTLVKVSPA